MFPTNAFDIGAEEAAAIIDFANRLNKSFKVKFSLPTDDPRVLAAGMNLMFNDEDFQDMAKTEAGKGLMIGAMSVAYYFSHVWRNNENSEIPDMLDVAGVMRKKLREVNDAN
jgi:hypothetical protein